MHVTIRTERRVWLRRGVPDRFGAGLKTHALRATDAETKKDECDIPFRELRMRDSKTGDWKTVEQSLP
jgi:hypothetical protein